MIQVSAIVPVFNGESTIAAAIDSVLNQNFDATEVIVVNDGSTDGTALILRSYGSKIRIIEQSNRGVSAARNAGAAIAHGEYLAFLDADDEWLPGKLAKAILALDRNAAATLVFSDVIQIGLDGSFGQPSHIGRAPSMDDLLTRNWGILPSSVVMRRRVFERCGGFREEITGPGCGEDTYMWMLAREQGEFEYEPEPLVLRRGFEFSELADKYRPNIQVYKHLLRQRYGERVKPLIKEVDLAFANSLVAKALRQMDNGERVSWMWTWMRALWFRPFYLLANGNFRLLMKPQNVRRLANLARIGRTKESRPRPLG
jgi:glycosyltransferase involved in cell wall biosynthesis